MLETKAATLAEEAWKSDMIKRESELKIVYDSDKEKGDITS